MPKSRTKVQPALKSPISSPSMVSLSNPSAGSDGSKMENMAADGIKAKTTSGNFVFIPQFGPTAANASPVSRKKIRSQAKKYAIKAKSQKPPEYRFVPSKVQTEAKLKVVDVSPLEEWANEELDIKVESPQSKNDQLMARRSRELILRRDLSKTGYEQARIRYGFDVSLLSGLASVHVGAGSSLQLYGSRLGDWLSGFAEQSYLDHIPQQYNSSTLLQKVINCTMAQYKRAMCPECTDITNWEVYDSYGAAVGHLQKAIDNPSRAKMPDVLLSTAVLQLFEVCLESWAPFPKLKCEQLLQNDTARHWSWHTLGLMNLLKIRDPSSLNEAEMSILSSQLGPLLNECFLRQQDCFAEKSQWEPVLLKLHRNNPLITSLLVAQSKLGRFSRIANQHVMHSPKNFRQKEKALEEMRGVKAFTYKWEADLQERMRSNDSVLNLRELPCAVWSCRINLNRIMVSLDPFADDARKLEEETQHLAGCVMEWWNETVGREGDRGDRLYTYPIPSAQIVQATQDRWRNAVNRLHGYVDHQRRTVHPSVFEDWTIRIRAKAPTRKYKYVERGP